jgi:hypothetical protein
VPAIGHGFSVAAAQFDNHRAADYRLDLPLTKLTAGRHLLTVEARAGELTVAREARFTVR